MDWRNGERKSSLLWRLEGCVEKGEESLLKRLYMDLYPSVIRERIDGCCIKFVVLEE